MSTTTNDTEMRATLHLGKIALYGTRRINAAELDLRLTDTDRGTKLAICGGIWNGPHTDYRSCGQNIEEIASLFPRNKKVQRIADIWRRWHLNGMRAGCEHQRALGWKSYDEHPSEPCPICGYKYGTAWLHEEIPADVLAEVRTLFGLPAEAR